MDDCNSLIPTCRPSTSNYPQGTSPSLTVQYTQLRNNHHITLIFFLTSQSQIATQFCFSIQLLYSHPLHGSGHCKGACVTQRRYETCCAGPPKMDGSSIHLTLVKSSNKMWSYGERNGNPLQYSCLQNSLMNYKLKSKLKSRSPYLPPEKPVCNS